MLYSRCKTGILLAAFSAGPCSGCQSLTAPQVAALNCVLASDGATVVAIVKPGLALPAAGLATIGCQSGTQIGQVLTSK